jgi:hypothetical protein
LRALFQITGLLSTSTINSSGSILLEAISANLKYNKYKDMTKSETSGFTSMQLHVNTRRARQHCRVYAAPSNTAARDHLPAPRRWAVHQQWVIIKIRARQTAASRASGFPA